MPTLPAASVAVHVTTVRPTGYGPSGAGVATRLTSTLSTTTGVPIFTVVVGPVAGVTTSAGGVSTGGKISPTPMPPSVLTVVVRLEIMTAESLSACTLSAIAILKVCVPKARLRGAVTVCTGEALLKPVTTSRAGGGELVTKIPAVWLLNSRPLVSLP